MTTSDSSAARMAISLRDFTEVWGNQNPDAVDQIYAAEFSGHGFPLGLTINRTQYRTLVELFHEAFPDGSMEVTELTADDEFVYADWTFTGTHSNSLFGIPPSTATVSFSGSGRHRHNNGSVSEIWVDAEWRSLYTQLLRAYLSRIA